MVTLKPIPTEEQMQTILSQMTHEHEEHLRNLPTCEHGDPKLCDDPECLPCQMTRFQRDSKIYRRFVDTVAYSFTVGVMSGQVGINDVNTFLVGLGFYAGYLVGRLQTTAAFTEDV